MITPKEINRLISIPGYEVQGFHFDKQGSAGVLYIQIKKMNRQFDCACGYHTNRYYDGEPFRVRDLPYGEWKIVYLVFRKYRIECPRCGVVTERLSWLEPWSRHTKRLTEEVALACRSLRPISDVAREYRLNWVTVKEIDKRTLEKELNPPDVKDVEVIAVDELSIRKGHKYATRVIDVEKRRTLWVARDRREESLGEFYKLLGPDGCKRIKAVAMDEHKPYIAATQKYCPQAMIVFDEFHILNNYSKVIDQVRNQESLGVSKEETKVIKGSKYLLLANRENLSEEKKIRLREVLKINRRLNTVYVLKDDLKQLWQYENKEEAQQWFWGWYRRAMYSGIEPLKKFACGLKNHLDGILSHCDYPINTSVLEGMNNLAKVIKRIAFGFRDMDYFFLKLRAHGLIRREPNTIPLYLRIKWLVSA